MGKHPTHRRLCYTHDIGFDAVATRENRLHSADCDHQGTTMTYACLCCGYMTLDNKPPGTYEICPICFWEDSASDSMWEKSNHVSLLEAQRNFLQFGACEREWLDMVRAPTEADKRPADWQTLDRAAETARSAVIAEITSAFDGVSREDGVTLHEADVIDDYGSDAERQKARRLDQDSRWQDVPETDIENYPILCFLDPKGWRYYIAAYMVWSLRHHMTSDSMSVDSTIYTFKLSKKEDLRKWEMSRYSTLTESQSKAVCNFLRFMRDHSHGFADELVARKALKKYWGRFCDEAE